MIPNTKVNDNIVQLCASPKDLYIVTYNVVYQFLIHRIVKSFEQVIQAV